MSLLGLEREAKAGFECGSFLWAKDILESSDVLLQCLSSSSCALRGALSLGAAPEQALVPFPGFDCDLPLPPVLP